MRKKILFLLLLSFFAFGFGCVKKQPVITRSFDTNEIINVGEQVQYSDGLLVLLEKINDSRCKEGVLCIWEGELSPVLTLSQGDLLSPSEVILGTSRTPKAQAGMYQVELKGATEKNVTVLITKKAQPDMVHVTNVKPGQVISSPLTVTGEARGPWYFEASFPVKLLDAQGKVLVVTPAQAQGDWMTENFVPFTVILNFTPTTPTGTLVLQKDNPSGLPENDQSYEIPVNFLIK